MCVNLRYTVPQSLSILSVRLFWLLKLYVALAKIYKFLKEQSKIPLKL